MTVYVEYVLIENILIDYMLLDAAFVLTKNRSGVPRLLICSVIGSVFALVMPLVKVAAVLAAVIKGAFGCALVLAANRYSSRKQFYITLAVFYLYTFLMGGGIIGIYGFFGLDYSGEFSVATMAAACYALYKITLRFVKKFYSKRHEYRNAVGCEAVVGGKVFALRALVDTGNRLCDPVTDEPVVVCSKKTALKFLGVLKDNAVLANLPVRTVGGESIIKIFRIDALKIYFGDFTNIIYNVSVGVAVAAMDYDLLLCPEFAEKRYDASLVS